MKSIFRHLLALACIAFTTAQAEDSTDVELVRIPHETMEIEGWTVHVDTSLLRGEHK